MNYHSNAINKETQFNLQEATQMNENYFFMQNLSKTLRNKHNNIKNKVGNSLVKIL